jgi:hypothetical protein
MHPSSTVSQSRHLSSREQSTQPFHPSSPHLIRPTLHSTSLPFRYPPPPLNRQQFHARERNGYTGDRVSDSDGDVNVGSEEEREERDREIRERDQRERQEREAQEEAGEIMDLLASVSLSSFNGTPKNIPPSNEDSIDELKKISLGVAHLLFFFFFFFLFASSSLTL